MSTLDRLVVGFAAVLLFASALIIAVTVYGSTAVVSWAATLRQAPFDGVVAALMLLFTGVYLAFLIGKPGLRQKFVVHHGQLGDVHISFASVRGLIVRAAEQVDGVKQIRAAISDGDPLVVKVELELLPDHHIPRVTEGVQGVIREYLQDTVGISIDQVEVSVTNVAGDANLRAR